MADGQVAGRLEVLVEASLEGFARELKRKVEAASEDVQAEIGVKVGTTAKELRQRLEKRVKKASQGVQAKVGIDLDAGTLKAKVAAAAAASAADVRVGADAEHLADDVAAKAAAATAAADKTPVRVPLRTRTGLWLEALRERFIAQRALDAKPLEVNMRVRRPRMRGILRGGMIVGLLSLVQPAVGAIGQLIGGLSAMAGAIAPATGGLAALPLGLSALVQGMVGVTAASQGVGQAIGALSEKQKALADGTEWTAEQQAKLEKALENVSPSARKFARRVLDLKGEWSDLRKEIQEPLFEPLAEHIKPVANRLLPTLQKGLKGTAEAVGEVVDQTAKWMLTDRFNQNFLGAMRQNNRTIESGGHSMRYLLDGWLEFQRAAEPFQRRMDRWMVRSARWFRDTMRENREDGSTAAFLQKAGDRLKVTWDIIKQFSGGIAGLFRAGDQSGMRLLETFRSFLTDWHSWVDSVEGQKYLSDWFEGIEGGFLEGVQLINDLFGALAKWAADPKIERMLNMLRTELGPALNDFLTTMADVMGENIIGLLTEVTRAINNMAPAIEVVSDLTGMLVGLLGVLNDFVESGGSITETLMSIGGALLAWRGLKRLTGFGGKGGGGRGGLIGGLLAGLGLGKGKGGGGHRGLKGAARGVDDLTKSGSKFNRALGKLARNPLAKKAGWVGVILGAVEMADQFGHLSYDVDEATGRINGSLDKTGTATAKTVGEIRTALEKSDVGKYAKDWDLDLDALARSIATDGRLVKQEIKRIEDNFSPLKGLWGFVTPGNDAHLLAGEITQDLNDILGAFDRGGRRVEAKATTFQRTVQSAMSKAFAPPKIPGVKPGKTITQGAESRINAALGIGKPTHSTPQISGNMAEKRAKDFARRFNAAIGRAPLKPPQVSPGIVQKRARNFARQFAGAVGKSPQKVRPPQVDASRIKAQGRKTGRQLLTSMQSATKGKKIRPPQIDSKKAGASARTAAKRIKTPFASIDKFVSGKARSAKLSVFRSTKAMGKSGQRGGREMKQGIEKGMNGVVTAVRSKGKNAKREAKGVSTGVKKPFEGLHGPMSVAGGNAMSGLTAGINARGEDAVAAARNIALRVAAASRTALQVRSPSRVMKRIGGFVSQGFADGIRGKLGAVRKAQRQLVNRLTKPWGKRRARRLMREYSKRFDRLENLARRKARVAARLERAEGRLERLQSARKSLREGLRSSSNEYASLTRVSGDNQGYLTPSYLIQELRKRATENETFTSLLAQLRKKGIGNRAYRQLVEAGVEEGLPIARQLIEATPEQLLQIKHLQNRMARAARGLGDQASKELFDAGIQASKGLVRGLKKRQRALNKAARSMARTMVKAIKRELGIKSPSRVTMGIGGNTVDGWNLGMLKKRKRLLKNARRLSNDLAQELTPSTHARTLHGNTRHSALAAGMAAPQAAPLVGKLIIQGRNRAEIQDALDEAMFKLRKIRQGGVHAVRTA